MGLETATYISQLNAAFPLGSDPRSQGDDHIRLIKAALKNTFPNLGGPVTKTAAQLNATPHDRAGVVNLVGQKIVTAEAFTGSVSPAPEIALVWNAGTGRLQPVVNGQPQSELAPESELPTLINQGVLGRASFFGKMKFFSTTNGALTASATTALVILGAGQVNGNWCYLVQMNQQFTNLPSGAGYSRAFPFLCQQFLGAPLVSVQNPLCVMSATQTNNNTVSGTITSLGAATTTSGSIQVTGYVLDATIEQFMS